MSAGASSVEGSSALRATAPVELFTRLIDDAAIFPPGNATLADAVRAHRGLRAGALDLFVGPLLCTASRLPELALVLDDEARQSDGNASALDIAVVTDTGTGGIPTAVDLVRADDRLQLLGIEAPLRAETDLGTATRRLAAVLLDSDLLDDCTVYVEVPRAATTLDALDVLAEYDLRAKLRTGGADVAAFPDEMGVARFFDACLDRELVFKCTAGLHNAVRHTAVATGFEHHGILNVLLAVDVLVQTGSTSDAAATLAERDAATLADRAAALTPAKASRVRRSFASYGSCSVTEPIDDLTALGLVAPQ